MSCYSDYITIDRSTTSRSGLYGSDLPGVEISMLQGLTKEDQDSYLELWDMIVSRAWSNMVSDISIALQNKFFVDSKIVSRVTSAFKDNINTSTGPAGVKIEFELPRYAKIHIVSFEVFAEQAYDSPEASFTIYDTDENGEVLYEGGQTLVTGRNTIYLNREFEADALFIAFDPAEIQLRETENKHYDNSPYINWSKTVCEFSCSYDGVYTGTVTQVNGGGLNVNYAVVCSIDKFACQNINLFKMAYWYRIGVELADEQLLGNRLNRFTTMTSERAAERSGYFGTKYTQNISEAIKSQNILEDPICFRCKSVAMSKTILP